MRVGSAWFVIRVDGTKICFVPIACQPPGDAMRHDFAPLALSHHLYVPFLQEKNMETYMFERKMDNCKPCGGAIPLCMIDEFKLPEKIVDRKV